ncbi:Ribulose bisphosphate carboxylase large chain [Platanthera guangdongensis]|uniref:Ribulose bisphosphate carboxylase large chain n=1 Tax=Platanthera guangdongensis TaxID=2320717 RepID=A0ABR2MEZ5_9ASPA
MQYQTRDRSSKEQGSPQTETKASVGFKAGVKDYKLTYYTPDYETNDTDILAAFRVTPQLVVTPEEAGTAVAAESSTGEIKGHYLNATAGTNEEMIKRAIFARELGVPIVMHDYLTGGFTANTSLA